MVAALGSAHHYARALDRSLTATIRGACLSYSLFPHPNVCAGHCQCTVKRRTCGGGGPPFIVGHMPPTAFELLLFRKRRAEAVLTIKA